MGSQMTITLTPELRRAFSPDMIATMETTLEAAWNALRSSESELATDENRAATRLMLAKRILTLAASGETKYGRLLMGALAGLLPDLASDLSASDGAAQACAIDAR